MTLLPRQGNIQDIGLTEQIGKGQAVIDMFQVASCYLTVIDDESNSSFLKQPCWKTNPVAVKIMLLFQRGHISDLYKKTIEEIALTTTNWLRTVVCFIKTIKDGAVELDFKKCVKISNDGDQRLRKYLVKN